MKKQDRNWANCPSEHQKINGEYRKIAIKHLYFPAYDLFLNKLSSAGQIGENNAKIFVQLVSPFAPHLSEEIWQKLGMKNSIIQSAWPTFDPEKAKENEIEIVFQVSGKFVEKGCLARMQATKNWN